MIKKGVSTDKNHINQGIDVNQNIRPDQINILAREKSREPKKRQGEKSKRELGPFRSTGVAPNALVQS